MRVTYVARSFLDYRIPVFEALVRKLDGDFHVVYSADYVPERVHARIQKSLGSLAIGMRGEKRLGPNEFPDFANTAVRIVYQPGLLKTIRGTRPDVMVGDGFFQWTSFALLSKLMHRVPLVICYERTFHTERNAQKFRILYRRMVLRFVDAMSCNGKLSREYATWLGMPENRITTGHMVADTTTLSRAVAHVPDSRSKSLRHLWGDADVAMLAVGRLNERKGIKPFLEAAARLKDTCTTSWSLGVVGTGPEEEALRRLADSLGLTNVYFHGSVDYSGIAEYYSAADVLVMPTLEDNWSLVVPEAMSCGLPVLCSIYNGCYPELVKEGENGWLFDPLDTENTVKALHTCLESGSDLAAMGKKSLEIAAGHTPEHAAEAILDACSIAINGAR